MFKQGELEVKPVPHHMGMYTFFKGGASPLSSADRCKILLVMARDGQLSSKDVKSVLGRSQSVVTRR